jgi:hypothetical protein
MLLKEHGRSWIELGLENKNRIKIKGFLNKIIAKQKLEKEGIIKLLPSRFSI